MKSEKGKIILIYILMVMVIILIVALTYVVINNSSKENSSNVSVSNNQDLLDVEVYPKVNDKCKFGVTMDEYNALSNAGCKGGYTRYDVKINDNIVVTVIYSDKNGKKTGLFVNDKKAISGVENVSSIKMGIFDNKLFIADNSSNSNLLVYDDSGLKLYDLKTALDGAKIKDSILSLVLTGDNINPNTFTFENNLFTFQTRAVKDGSVTLGGSYQVSYSGKQFSKPVLKKE